jgi:hypothetical protein
LSQKTLSSASSTSDPVGTPGLHSGRFEKKLLPRFCFGFDALSGILYHLLERSEVFEKTLATGGGNAAKGLRTVLLMALL